MKKYIIKVTYLEGIHEGKTHHLGKGGYIVTNLDFVWQEDSYTLSTCKSVCTRLENQNNRLAEAEKRERAYNAAKGRHVSKYPIYIVSKYEPFMIETVDR